MRILPLILFVVAWSSPAFATPFVPDFSGGPVVFDFENGLDGWVTDGSAQRVNTQVLGGQWAIFGDALATGGTVILLELDLTNTRSITFEQFHAGSPASPNGIAFLATTSVVEGILVGRALPWTVVGTNPSILVADASNLVGVHTLGLVWRCFSCDPTGPVDSSAGLGFVDNITLLPVPEPRSFLLLATAMFGLLGVGIHNE